MCPRRVDCDAIALEDDQDDDTGEDEPKVDGKVANGRDEEAAVLAHMLSLVGSLDRTRATDGIFAAGANTRKPATNNEHPEHAEIGRAVCGGAEDDAEDEHTGGGDHAEFAAHAVNESSKQQHADDFTNEKRV